MLKINKMGKENWKKERGESSMLEYEKKQMAKAKEEFKKRKKPRDLYLELRTIGLTIGQCSEVLEWINTLPIRITGNNHTVKIEDGIITVSNTDDK